MLPRAPFAGAGRCSSCTAPGAEPPAGPGKALRTGLSGDSPAVRDRAGADAPLRPRQRPVPCSSKMGTAYRHQPPTGSDARALICQNAAARKGPTDEKTPVSHATRPCDAPCLALLTATGAITIFRWRFGRVHRAFRGPVAQLVEQLTFNQLVGGSSPPGLTNSDGDFRNMTLGKAALSRRNRNSHRKAMIMAAMVMAAKKLLGHRS